MAAVSGSLFRRILFWAHLGCGVAAGVFIFVMAASGVLLTYERQIVDRAGDANRVTAPAGQSALDADRLARAARDAIPGQGRINLVFNADPSVPVSASRGGGGSALLDPYTGSVIKDASQGERQFFRVVENWHRWLGEDSRSTRAPLVDYGNLLFLFIVLSGIYIWLPKVWRWRNWRGLMFFQTKYINAKVRDFNWHHVFSFWMLIPLFLISLSGVVMSFGWANQLVYAAYGEEAQQRRPPGPAPGAQPGNGDPREGGREESPRVSLESLRVAAAAQLPNWQRLTMPVDGRGLEVEISAELKSEARPASRQSARLSTVDASVIRVSPVQGAATQSAGQRARTWMRFVHTGEQYGVIGQTIAGVASLAACFLVYTGLALAYRRLLRPFFKRSTPA